MFVMTEAAGVYISALLDRAQIPQEAAVRLVIEGDSVETTLDTPRPGDASYDHEGRRVLLLDARASQLLEDSRLDVQPTADGERLVLTA